MRPLYLVGTSLKRLVVARAVNAIDMTSQPGAERFMPDRTSLSALREAAAGCEGCELFQAATQTVFGTGPARARLVFIGQQPGDQEDRAGEPFVGPAGRLLDHALADAGLSDVPRYVTNAVKHFRFTERGKRRIHRAPNRGQLRACLPWLTAELKAIRPELVVCLGATAAHAVFGPDFRLTQHRGELLEPAAGPHQALATVHPSSVLRAEDRDEAYARFVADLEHIPVHKE
jgi:DNA polymerase